MGEEYPVPSSFTGTIQQVTIEVQPIAVADRAAVEESAISGWSDWPCSNNGEAPPGMQWVPSGTFPMGADRFYPEEASVHTVTLSGIWIVVINAQFAAFVRATGIAPWRNGRLTTRSFRALSQAPLGASTYDIGRQAAVWLRWVESGSATLGG